MAYPTDTRPGRVRGALGLAAVIVLAGCASQEGFDLDLRDNLGNAFDTSSAVRGGVAPRPQPDARGVITYPNYQVVVARGGDTVETIAARIGVPADRLASYNGLPRNRQLRNGELVALPGESGDGAGSVQEGLSAPEAIESQSLEDRANAAIDRADQGGQSQPRATRAPADTAGGEPRRHRVADGETAYTIARAYGVPVQALAEWNGLGDDPGVRQGQVLLIPPASPAPEQSESAPGQGTVAPSPPSAARPLPEEEATQEPEETPESPNLAEDVTESSVTGGRLLLPVSGPVVRDFSPGTNDGIDIRSTPGTPVRAADAGTVAAITRDTDQIPILVLRHEGGLLTVYAGVANIAVAQGDSVARGETIARVRDTDPAILHFEVREGFESVDPTDYLE